MSIVKFCKRCGVDTERRANGRCNPCQREAQRRCMRKRRENPEVRAAEREYREVNAGRIRERNRQYLKDNAAKIVAYYNANARRICARQCKYHAANASEINSRRRVYRKENAESIREQKRKYYLANVEKISAYRRKYLSGNADRAREYAREYNRANLGKLLAHNARRRARKLSQICACCKKEAFAKLYAQARARKAHVDHIKPLALGGLHCLRNLQLLTPMEHAHKTAHHDKPMIAAARRERRNAL